MADLRTERRRGPGGYISVYGWTRVCGSERVCGVKLGGGDIGRRGGRRKKGEGRGDARRRDDEIRRETYRLNQRPLHSSSMRSCEGLEAAARLLKEAIM